MAYARWVQCEEIGWVQFQEIRWVQSEEIAWVQLEEILHHEGPSSADALAQALKLDLRKWWSPNAPGYFSRISKAAILQAVTEGLSAEAAAAMGKLKKEALALEASKALLDKGWLPAFLRGAWMSNGDAEKPIG